MKHSTRLFSGLCHSSVPRPNARWRFLSAIIRRIHHKSDEGLACWASTFTDS